VPEPETKTRTTTRKGQTKIRFEALEAMDDYEEVRQKLGFDLPILPINGDVRRCRHPDPEEWDAKRLEATERGKEETALMRYFSPDTTKEQDVSDSKDDEKDDEEAPFDPVESLGIFCANLDITKQHNPHTVMQFYSRMLNRAKLTVGRRSEFQSHWEQFNHVDRPA